MWGFLLRIVVSVVLSGIAAFLSYRKPPTPAAGTLDDVGNPRADEGAEIKKVFGTVTVKDPQVAWFGNFRTEPITQRGPRRFGFFGRRSTITIGYRYFLGAHFIPCLGPVDTLNRVRIDKRIAFLGSSNGGLIQICKPNLFGASDREGGVTGFASVMMGDAAQGANDYLAANTGAPQPAYRGVMSVVLRQMYIGNAPNLRPFEFRVARLNSVDPGYNGGAQWLPDFAEIYQRTVRAEGEPQSVFIAIDTSGSMNEIVSGSTTRLDNAKAAVIGFLNSLAADVNTPYVVRIVDWNDAVDSSITSSSFDALISFVGGLTAGGLTNFEGPYSDAASFFGGEDLCRIRRMLFITDGIPSSGVSAAATIYQNFNNVGVLGVSIDTAISTELRAVSDRAVRVDGGDPVEVQAALLQLFDEFDMNPAHILREVLISPDMGGSGVSADAGDSWETAAEALFNEGFGLSIAWSNTSDRGEFKSEVERHIDARSFIDRRTGLWEIKLIRDDYDAETLPVFDSSNVISWNNISFPEPHTLINQLAVVWNDPEKDETTSLTISNPARIRMSGSRVIQEKVEYPGINRTDLASRVAARDLAARSAPLITGEFVATYLPEDINLGSAIVINNPRLGIINRVVRVLEIEDGNIRDNSAVVRFVEDRFALGEAGPIEIEVIEPEIQFPQPVAPRFAEEAPRFLVFNELGETTYDEVFTAEPTGGFLHVAGVSPSAISQDAILQVDAGDGYEEIQSIAFSRGGTTLAALSDRADHTLLVVQSRDDLSAVAANSLAKIGNEHLIISSVASGDTSSTGDYYEPTIEATLGVYTLTLQRAVMDTSPAVHEAGAGLVIYGEVGYIEDDLFVDPASLDVKLQTVTSRGVLALVSAPVDVVDFDSRVLRPYPPGSVQVDGEYFTPDLDTFTTAEITWTHRDRLDNTLLPHSDSGPAGPETGTTYNVRGWVVESDGSLVEPPEIDTNVGSLLTYTLDVSGITINADQSLRVIVSSERDSLESLFNRSLDFVRSESFLLLSSSDELDPPEYNSLAGDAAPGVIEL